MSLKSPWKDIKLSGHSGTCREGNWVTGDRSGREFFFFIPFIALEFRTMCLYCLSEKNIHVFIIGNVFNHETTVLSVICY